MDKPSCADLDGWEGSRRLPRRDGTPCSCSPAKFEATMEHARAVDTARLLVDGEAL
jgi:hypothetical protein